MTNTDKPHSSLSDRELLEYLAAEVSELKSRIKRGTLLVREDVAESVKKAQEDLEFEELKTKTKGLVAEGTLPYHIPTAALQSVLKIGFSTAHVLRKSLLGEYFDEHLELSSLKEVLELTYDLSARLKEADSDAEPSIKYIQEQLSVGYTKAKKVKDVFGALHPSK